MVALSQEKVRPLERGLGVRHPSLSRSFKENLIQISISFAQAID
jgi:hypothetical protein